MKAIISFFLSENHTNLRKNALKAILCLVFAIAVAWYFSCHREPLTMTTIVKGYTERQKYEAERTERMIDAIDKKKEAELNAINETVALSDVVDVLDALLAGRSKRLAHD